MAEDKNGFRRHVRAAREWLGETEESLAKEDELKGDLNFMLAQAELKRAREVQKPHGGIRLLPQLAALLTACLLAGGWWLWQQHEDAAGQKMVTPAAVQKTDTAGPKAAEKVPTGALLPERGVADAKMPGVQADGQADKQLPDGGRMSEPEEVRREGVQQAVLPDEDLQRLMSEAGRSLRAQ